MDILNSLKRDRLEQKSQTANLVFHLSQQIDFRKSTFFLVFKFQVSGNPIDDFRQFRQNWSEFVKVWENIFWFWAEYYGSKEGWSNNNEEQVQVVVIYTDRKG